MLPEVLEYCMEPPEKIALELENFYNLPYRGKPPYYLVLHGYYEDDIYLSFENNLFH